MELSIHKSVQRMFQEKPKLKQKRPEILNLDVKVNPTYILDVIPSIL